jgi:hypothetical protein
VNEKAGKFDMNVSETIDDGNPMASQDFASLLCCSVGNEKYWVTSPGLR